MFLKMIIKGKEADKVSYMIGKNPENVYISNERVISEISEQDLVGLKFVNDNEIFLKESSFGDKIKNLLLKDKVIDKDGDVLRGKKYAYIVKDNILVRRKNDSRAETYLVFQKYDSEEVEFSLFTIADSNKLGEGFKGYVNEREFLAGSLFSLEIFDTLRNAIKRTGDYYDNKYNIQVEIGPFIPKCSEENIIKLFDGAGLKNISIQNLNLDISFKSKREKVISLSFEAEETLGNVLKKLIVLSNAIDNFIHYKPDENNLNKFKKLTDGWIEEHPLKNLIIKRNLNYSSYANEYIDELSVKEVEEKELVEDVIEKGYGENGESLNTTRMNTMKNLVLKTNPKSVLDLGCGEGKLLRMLGFEDLDKVVGMDSSSKSVFVAKKQLERLSLKENFKKPEVVQGSLYYRDSRLKGFDTIILCEVIEHIDELRVMEVIDNILWLEPKNFILSTPNRSFNKFFKDGEMLSNGLRHYDHRFEFTEEEFKDFCDEICKKYNYSYKEVVYYGKEIEGIKPTMAVTFKRGEN